MKRISFLLTVLLFIACKKNHDAPPINTKPILAALKAHTWVFDSALISLGDTSWKLYDPQGYLFLNFTDSFLIQTNLTLTTGSIDTVLYKLVEPNRIYKYQWDWWQQPTTTDTSEYTIIETLTIQSLVMKYKQQIYSLDLHYHAKD